MSKARTVDSKMIVIEGRGRVTTSRGLTTTPITSPYREKCSVIWGLLTKDKATVAEVLPDGTKVYLSVQNFNTDNTTYAENNKGGSAKAVAAPTGMSDQFEKPQNATDKATEKFYNNSTFTHETSKDTAVEETATPDAQVPVRQNNGGPQINYGGKKKNRNRDHQQQNYQNQQATNGDDQEPSREPVKDLSVGMESL